MTEMYEFFGRIYLGFLFVGSLQYIMDMGRGIYIFWQYLQKTVDKLLKPFKI